MATTPRVYLGLADSGVVWRMNEGYLDGPTSDGGDPPVYTGGVAYSVRAVSARVAPSGPKRESIFAQLELVVTHTMATVLRVTPILDGVTYDGTGGTQDLSIDITLADSTERVTEKFLVELAVPLIVATVNRGTNAMRGTWFQVKVETADDLAAGDLIFDLNVLEYEPSADTVAVTQ